MQQEYDKALAALNNYRERKYGVDYKEYSLEDIMEMDREYDCPKRNAVQHELNEYESVDAVRAR